MIQNFIFDMGNVLMDFSPDYMLSQYTDDMKVIKALKDLIFGNTLWSQLDNGDVSFDEAKDGLLKSAPVEYHTLIRDILNTWHLHKVPRLDMLELIKELKEKGYGIYLCSNAADRFHSYKDTYEVFQYFDGLLISADIHISKPDIRIYEYLLDSNKLIAEECLFVDDLGANTKAAESVGMYAYQYNGNLTLFRHYLKNVHLI
ncbi:HAD family phosphatase [Erysipelothrix sp. HDW6C]|uniref:HAD family hydrolase n=1 Tax=Erysipelothrix sp. HDW6C TaxID=2714930 RepID=UPI00140B475A|nr:HAD family phosphatase [Erysipelothrix sp. HDW6C]QIK70503.1 HAD family phosphatase [Erysipelothrix sp. HDW6C]